MGRHVDRSSRVAWNAGELALMCHVIFLQLVVFLLKKEFSICALNIPFFPARCTSEPVLKVLAIHCRCSSYQTMCCGHATRHHPDPIGTLQHVELVNPKRVGEAAQSRHAERGRWQRQGDVGPQKRSCASPSRCVPVEYETREGSAGWRDGLKLCLKHAVSSLRVPHHLGPLTLVSPH